MGLPSLPIGLPIWSESTPNFFFSFGDVGHQLGREPLPEPLPVSRIGNAANGGVEASKRSQAVISSIISRQISIGREILHYVV